MWFAKPFTWLPVVIPDNQKVDQNNGIKMTCQKIDIKWRDQTFVDQNVDKDQISETWTSKDAILLHKHSLMTDPSKPWRVK